MSYNYKFPAINDKDVIFINNVIGIKKKAENEDCVVYQFSVWAKLDLEVDNLPEIYKNIFTKINNYNGNSIDSSRFTLEYIENKLQWFLLDNKDIVSLSFIDNYKDTTTLSHIYNYHLNIELDKDSDLAKETDRIITIKKLRDI
ncbi:hypothetical protein Bp8pS_108 [Bacillus phage vB_BpuM-BpSp]|nr:hypothetical protein Bp8pS_108 [Bacillus phage vB_BpuM-BpSp]